MLDFFADSVSDLNHSIPIIPILRNDFSDWIKGQPDHLRNWMLINDFTAKSASCCIIPNQHGKIEQVFLGIKDNDDFWAFASLPQNLYGSDIYRIESKNFTKEQLQRILIGWGLGGYRYTRYKTRDVKKSGVKLLLPEGCDRNYVENIVSSVYFVRDAINMPAEDMNTKALAKAAEDIASQFGAEFRKFVGEELLQQNFPSVHMMGRASVNPPILVDINWGAKNLPKVTLVGKGVCFDSGGLDLKPPSGMEAMKKDMGGAAHVLGLAQMIMRAKLPINLRVIIPIIENLVSGSSCKPGDIVKTRKGITVEITNTDAEGRMILCDALAYACESNPEMLIDFATLTGAARVAVGTEISALFGNDDKIVEDVINCANREQDAMWHMPLFTPYKELMESKIADLQNASNSGYGGAITAALFLEEFIDAKTKWLHFDIMGSNVKTKPGRPQGGEAMGIRGVFNYLQRKFSA